MSEPAQRGTGTAASAAQVASTPPPERPLRRNRRSAMARDEARAGLSLISPTLVIVVVMVVLPILWTIMLAFQRVRLLNLRSVGLFGKYTLANLQGVLTSPGFLQALLTTILYAVLSTAAAIGLGLIATLALRKPFRGRNFVRASMLLPYIAPVVAVTFIWKTMLNPQFGIVNHWGTRLLGWDKAVAFLSATSNEVSLLGWHFTVPTALLTVIAFEAWRTFPFVFLFLTARLQAAPISLEEAARVDGATPTRAASWRLIGAAWSLAVRNRNTNGKVRHASKAMTVRSAVGTVKCQPSRLTSLLVALRNATALSQPSSRVPQWFTNPNCGFSIVFQMKVTACLLYTSPSPRDGLLSRMP